MLSLNGVLCAYPFDAILPESKRATDPEASAPYAGSCITQLIFRVSFRLVYCFASVLFHLLLQSQILLSLLHLWYFPSSSTGLVHLEGFCGTPSGLLCSLPTADGQDVPLLKIVSV